MLPYASRFHHAVFQPSGDIRMRRVMRYVLSMLAGLPALLGAQGFGIYEQNTCTMARAGAAAAAPCADGSAIFFNPAGLAGLRGGHASVGVTLIDISGGFTDALFQQHSTLDDPVIPVPQAYVSYGVTPKLGVGIGLFAPYGLETQWPLAFDGRFAGYNNKIHTLYVQPTVAYQVTPWLKLGGGLDIVHGSVELHQRLDLATTPIPPGLIPGVPTGTTFGAFGVPLGTDFADADLSASKTSVGGHIGAIARVNDRLSFGVHYLSKVTLDYSGTGRFTQVNTGIVIPADITLGSPPQTIPAGTPLDAFLASLGLFTNTALLGPQAVSASIPNPDMLVAGVAFKPRDDVTLLADYQWTHWSAFKVLTLEFSPNTLLNQALYERYKNTSGFRVGGEWVTTLGVTVRGGYLHHGGAAPAETVTPLLPEGQRNEVTAGVAVKLGPQLTADVAYQYIHQDDRLGRTRETPNVPPTTALNDGLYTFSAHLFGVSLALTF
jgi:long-chain fatty acid transport protein